MRSFLLRPGFQSLLAVQFLGAANDNILKQLLTYMVATGVWAGALGTGGQAWVGLCLAVPFIVLSGFAGQFSDRWSKRRVIWIVKIVEIPIALVAGVAFFAGSLPLALAAMVLLAAQSAFFGPAKYGVVPELVDDRDLPRANGTLNMLTNVAVILGGFAAGPISDAYAPAAGTAPSTWARLLPGLAFVGTAIVGVLATLPLPRLAPAQPDLPLRWDLFSNYVSSVREMARGPVLGVALMWGGFYLMGSLALLVVPDFQAILAISFEQTGYLIAALAVAIGIGSALAGLASGHRIRPGLVSIGAAGMVVVFAAMGVLAPTAPIRAMPTQGAPTIPPEFWTVLALLVAAGTLAGFFIVPLQALLQALSPDDERGRFLGAANGISFCFISAASVLFAAARWLGMPSPRIFLVCAALSAVALVISRRLVEPRVRTALAAQDATRAGRASRGGDL